MTVSREPVILIADDDKNIVYAFQQTFKKRAKVITAPDGEAALDQLRSGKPHIAFIDITMPKRDGLSVLTTAAKEGSQIPIIIITGFGTMNTAIDAMKQGAFDYITKPLDVDNLRRVAERALEVLRLRQEVSQLKTELTRTHSVDEIIGSHLLMQEVFKRIGTAVQTPVATNILITGESGTGKELVAKAIHRSGSSSEEPFLPINCSAIPENLLETELFGHARGAFTGATQAKRGKFEVAGEGTIFLDEVGDLTPVIQIKLLRVLEAREFTPIGGHRIIPVKARFIAATNRDLTTLMEHGSFRKDLYYRLNVFPIQLPTLRERRDDIPDLVHFFIKRHKWSSIRNITAIADDALALLKKYDFPGNVRELQNIIISAASHENSEILTLASLPPYVLRPTSAPSGSSSYEKLSLRAARQQAMAVFEVGYLRQLLTRSRGNVTHASQEAGVTRQSLQRMMRAHGIKSTDFRN